MRNTRSSRELEARNKQLIENYNMEPVSPFDPPPGVARDGCTYHWANYSIVGENNYEVERLAAKGWTLPSVDRSTRINVNPLGRNQLAEKYFCVQDVILMENNAEIRAIEEQAQHRVTAKKLTGLSGMVKNDTLGKSFNHSTFGI